MTAASTWNIVCDQGKTFIRTFTYGAYEGNTFVPFDNTDWNARMHIRTTFSSEEIVVNLTNQNGGITLAGEVGDVTITIEAGVMENLLGKYVYDLELYQQGASEIVRSPIRGEIQVRPEVTR